jgi:hypothetical protein
MPEHQEAVEITPELVESVESSQQASVCDHESRQEKLVPVTEAIRYRKRAQAAEQQLASLQTQLDELRVQLNASRETITSLERRQKIDAMLAEADAIDLEAARLLTEAAVANMDEPDVAQVVADLRRHKPYLFRRGVGSGSASMSPRLSDEHVGAEKAAERALGSGNRRDLLEYLRLRRRT